MELSITEIQAYENDLLRELSRVCKENNLTYYMAYGSLLGTIRHGRSIPWDPDVDIFVPEKEYVHFLEELEKHMSEDFWINYRTEGMPHYCFARLGKRGLDTEIIHVDIFRLANLPDSGFIRQSYRIISSFCLHARAAKSWPIEHFTKKKRKKVRLVKALLLPFSNDFFVKVYDFISSKCVDEDTKYVGELGSKFMFNREWFGVAKAAAYENFEVMIPCNADAILSKQYGRYMEYPPEEERRKAYSTTYSVREIK